MPALAIAHLALGRVNGKPIHAAIVRCKAQKLATVLGALCPRGSLREWCCRTCPDGFAGPMPGP